MNKLVIALMLIALPFSALCQDTSRLRISLLTCTPGDELYSLFGHSAIRIVDSSTVTDIVFNYGTFNFDDKNFYLKFARGKLDYFLSLEYYNDFVSLYQNTGRNITEQVLNLSSTEKINLQNALLTNAREENRYYKYDFFFDNCTTRLRDLIVQYKHPSPILPPAMGSDMRFREAIHEYLDNGKQYWSKLGIDILLGTPTDAIMTASQQQFLPNNLMTAIDSCKNTVLVSKKSATLAYTLLIPKAATITPMVLFITLLVLFGLLSRTSSPFLVSLLKRLDSLLFFTTGLLGIILLFMWFGTDHSMTKQNFNLWWAFPTNAIVAFFIPSNKKWPKSYFGIYAILLAVLLITWFLLPQQLNIALIPLVVLLLFRSTTLYLFHGKEKNNLARG
ncbi:MAG: DUF4105 domain-containing protein [Ferruginibacter sp.]|nr:DUF4105 domain-containing protein [Ferruginibacter sp.]